MTHFHPGHETTLPNAWPNYDYRSNKKPNPMQPLIPTVKLKSIIKDINCILF